MDIRFDRARVLTVHHFSHRRSVINMRSPLREVDVEALGHNQYLTIPYMVDIPLMEALSLHPWDLYKPPTPFLTIRLRNL